jgi:peptide/nickel transport system substrate-binding protein
MVVNTEVSNLSPKVSGPFSPFRTTRIFNANLTLVDARDEVRPYLAESLPQLNTESWRVLPDGRMETTWKLRSNLTWHDGVPLTADDVAFAFRVYTAPELQGIFEPKPQDRIDRLVALDAHTIRIFWRSPFLHTGEGLDPLPRHLLADAFTAFEEDPAAERDAYMALRYWTTEYVGAGPYQLTAWDPASHLEGRAFAGHALGSPRIDRVVIRIINNENTVLANVMAGEVHYTMSQALNFERAMTLRRQAGFNDSERKGVLLFLTTATTTAMVQFRPEHQRTPGLLDPRVRKAVAHAIDRYAINDGLYDGQAPVPISFVKPTASYHAEVDHAIIKYPYDPRRTEALMAEAGYTRVRDGVFVDPTGERFRPHLWVSGSAPREPILSILLSSWQPAGIDAEAIVATPALDRDLEARATFPGILVTGTGLTIESTPLMGHLTERIPTAANRWSGNNYSGWSHPGFEQLWERYNTTLQRTEQVQSLVEMLKLHSEHVPTMALNYNINVTSHVAALRGPQGDAFHWNIHEWEMAP